MLPRSTFESVYIRAAAHLVLVRRRRRGSTADRLRIGTGSAAAAAAQGSGHGPDADAGRQDRRPVAGHERQVLLHDAPGRRTCSPLLVVSRVFFVYATRFQVSLRAAVTLATIQRLDDAFPLPLISPTERRSTPRPETEPSRSICTSRSIAIRFGRRPVECTAAASEEH